VSSKEDDYGPSYGGFPPHVNRDTSAEAAGSIKHRAANLRSHILAFICEHRGSSCDRIEDELGLRHQTASARVRELFLAGHIKDVGLRAVARSGRKVIVWLPRSSTP